MAEVEEIEHPAKVNGDSEQPFGAAQDSAPQEKGDAIYRGLTEDKEQLNYKRDFKEIKVADIPDDRAVNNTISEETPIQEERSLDQGNIVLSEEQDEEPTSPVPPPPPEKDDKDLPPPTPRSIGTLPSTPAANGTDVNGRERSDSVSTEATQATTATRRSSAPLSSIIFVVSALEQIAASKEARRKGELGDAAQKALEAIKRVDSSPNPEVIFEPLRLATETSSIPLTTTALDCIGKLISYSYFSIPADPQDPNAPPNQQQLPLIDRAIETICDCFQNEATPYEVQLQIVKSLLAAVLNDKLIVHGSGLLKAVRQVYNIFLISKSTTNQQVAQGTLTQMIGTVFERVNSRLAMKEARLNLAKLGSDKGTVNSSQVDLNGSSPAIDSGDLEIMNEPETASDGNTPAAIDQPVPKEPGERLTLQSLENAQIFDDRRIGDNAPTMVTPAKTPHKSTRTASGQPVMSNGDDEHVRADTPDEDDEDEIFVKDAFLVFRSMCRLSHKELGAHEQQDIQSTNMRSKLISLAIIRTTLNNNMAVFSSPLCTIRGTNNEPTSFGQAVNQYLRLSVSRNGASSVRRVFETTAEIFWLMLKDLRVMLKV